jgi:hypothetical protein
VLHAAFPLLDIARDAQRQPVLTDSPGQRRLNRGRFLVNIMTAFSGNLLKMYKAFAATRALTTCTTRP